MTDLFKVMRNLPDPTNTPPMASITGDPFQPFPHYRGANDPRWRGLSEIYATAASYARKAMHYDAHLKQHLINIRAA